MPKSKGVELSPAAEKRQRKANPDPINVYVATTYELHASAELYRFYINHFREQHPKAPYPLQVVANWIDDETQTQTVQEKAQMDFGDIDACQALVAFWPFGKGTSAEIAWAVAKDKQVILYVPADYYDDGLIPCMPVGLGVRPYIVDAEVEAGMIWGHPVIVHNLFELAHVLQCLTPAPPKRKSA